MPLNDAAKAWALSHSEEQASEPERQCAFYTSTYFPFGFAPLPMWKETELRSGSTVAWVVGGWLDVVPMVIWMDGRPHPSAYAPHSASGFTTGAWENDVLTTYTTHMIANLLHRRGPQSDLATMTLRFSRHADILSLTGRIEDPVYLAEPLYVSREWQFSSVPVNRAAVPCTIAYEGVRQGEVPHYRPGIPLSKRRPDSGASRSKPCKAERKLSIRNIGRRSRTSTFVLKSVSPMRASWPRAAAAALAAWRQ
jgi:hypothetical protein